MLFRPPEYLEDVRERALEIKAMEARLGVRDLHCPVCRAEIEDDFLVCPVCTTRLRQACSGCGKPLEPAWQVCPFCETPVPADDTIVVAAAEPAPRQRRRARPANS
jgi:predicted amidophosphoribosyltransferase